MSNHQLNRISLICARAALCLLAVTGFAAAATERQTAEWAIRQGGRVLLDGSRTPINDLSQLPAGAFHITGMDLLGTQVEPKDLARIGSLSELRELDLPGPMWTPFSDSPLDANEELKGLAGLKQLERLYFSLTFLATYNLQDKGISLLAPLTNLRELRLAQSHVIKPDLSPFVHLQSLDLSDSTISDEGIQVLESLKDLRRLYRETPP